MQQPPTSSQAALPEANSSSAAAAQKRSKESEALFEDFDKKFKEHKQREQRNIDKDINETLEENRKPVETLDQATTTNITKNATSNILATIYRKIALEEEYSKSHPPWKLKDALSKELGDVLIDDLLKGLARDGPPKENMEIAFFRALVEGSPKVIVQAFLEQNTLQNIYQKLKAKAALYAEASETGEKLHDKFIGHLNHMPSTEMVFGDKADFFGGLEERIGCPRADVLNAIFEEHCEGCDSKEPWKSNTVNGLPTTSLQEFFLVGGEIVEQCEKDHTNSSNSSDTKREFPSEWHDAAKFLEKKRNEVFSSDTRWPKWEDWHRPNIYQRTVQDKTFLEKLLKKNVELVGIKAKELSIEEGTLLRLYTGPLYEKYNVVPRFGALTSCSEGDSEFKRLCGNTVAGEFQVNRYVTSIHALTSGVIKLSKLTRAQTVYRGLSGRTLPEKFWKDDKFNCKGGVDFACQSFTLNDSKTNHFLTCKSKDVSILMKMDMGLVDRGADLADLSQFPDEQEILFPPLTSLEVRGTEVTIREIHEKPVNVVVVNVRPNINLRTPTIDEMVAKRHKLLIQMKDADRLQAKRHFQGWQWQSLAGKLGSNLNLEEKLFKVLDEKTERVLSEKASFYNNDEAYMAAMQQLVEIAAQVRLQKSSLLRDLESADQRSVGQTEVGQTPEATKVVDDEWEKLREKLKTITKQRESMEVRKKKCVLKFTADAAGIGQHWLFPVLGLYKARDGLYYPVQQQDQQSIAATGAPKSTETTTTTFTTIENPTTTTITQTIKTNIPTQEERDKSNEQQKAADSEGYCTWLLERKPVASKGVKFPQGWALITAKKEGNDTEARRDLETWALQTQDIWRTGEEMNITLEFCAPWSSKEFADSLLEKLGNPENPYDPDDPKYVATYLLCNFGQKELDFNKKDIGDEKAKILFDAVAHTSGMLNLETLILSGNKLGSGFAKSFSAAAHCFPRLLHLQLFNNPELGSDPKNMLEFLAAVAEHCSLLEVLQISQTGFEEVAEEVDVDSLKAIFQKLFWHLESLQIDRNPKLGYRTAIALVGGLQKAAEGLKNLKKADEGLQKKADDSLPLKRLWLYDNPKLFESESHPQLCQDLMTELEKSCASLEELRLNHTGLKGSLCLGPLVSETSPCFKKLRELSLYSNPDLFESAEGSQKFLENLGGCKSLEGLWLYETGLCHGAEALAGTLPKLTCLRTLLLYNNPNFIGQVKKADATGQVKEGDAIDQVEGADANGQVEEVDAIGQVEEEDDAIARTSTFLKSLDKCEEMKELWLGNIGLRKGSRAMTFAFLCLPKLTKLMLDSSANLIAEESAAKNAAFIRALSTLTSLEEIHLNDLGPLPEDSAPKNTDNLSKVSSEIAAAVKKLPNLRTLLLNNNPAIFGENPEAAKELLHSLADCRHLKELCVANTDLRWPSTMQFPELPQLSKLNLEYNPHFLDNDPERSREFMQSLAKCKNLKELHLAEIGLVGDDNGGSLAFPELPNLTMLDLSYNENFLANNQQRSHGFMQTLAKCTRLEELNIVDVGLCGDDAGKSLKESLSKMPELKKLLLFKNPKLSDEARETIKTAAKKHAKLKDPLIDEGSAENCPGRHGLEEYTVEQKGSVCDCCRQEMPVPSQSFRCKDCNWDACANCKRVNEDSAENCPGRHGLKRRTITQAGISCGLCRGVMRVDSKSSCCDLCKWDVCEVCTAFYDFPGRSCANSEADL